MRFAQGHTQLVSDRAGPGPHVRFQSLWPTVVFPWASATLYPLVLLLFHLCIQFTACKFTSNSNNLQKGNHCVDFLHQSIFQPTWISHWESLPSDPLVGALGQTEFLCSALICCVTLGKALLSSRNGGRSTRAGSLSRFKNVIHLNKGRHFAAT